MYKIAIKFFIFSIFLSGCSLFRTTDYTGEESQTTEIVLDTVDVSSRKTAGEDAELKHENPYKTYKGSAEMQHELIHTKLDLSFDIPEEQVFGKAEITLRPYFYKTDSVVLDARGFDIHQTAFTSEDGSLTELKHRYDGEQLIIYNREMKSREDTFTLFVDYTANPNRLSGGGSWAIRENKGMYFQNPESDNPQIWTQGEPEANSGWFPTIDKPNQRMSQEILLTVGRDFETLSNGKKINVLLNDDGTKTVHWKQEKPHTPYLAAVIIGRFDLIKYHWRNKPVYVYAEKQDIEKAKPTFNKSVEMLEFFSQKFDYDFPWDKYSQVVVRDFISGAMENTGAAVYSKYFLSPVGREIYRPDKEIVVAHELSHHWFGNLVTCESWANIPLNEAFATYAEYLWLEHKYGRFTADKHRENSISHYFFEAMYKNVDLIRYKHSEPGDMFDLHSYNKGSAVLHMLRREVGDEAFFAALAHYLKKHEYSSTEIHDLRLAFEEVTGRDMNYFFNAWFLNKGFLDLDIQYNTKDSLNWQIKVRQKQSPEKAPLYKLKVPTDIYFPDTVIRKELILDEEKEIYKLSFDRPAELVKFDAENSLLCRKTENRNKQDYLFILRNVDLYNDQNQAINYLKSYIAEEEVADAFMSLLSSPYYAFRLKALDVISLNDKVLKSAVLQNRLRDMAEDDPDLEVRRKARSLSEI